VGAPRITVSGATTAITRRAAYRKAFVAPWHPLVRDIWLYSLAWAQHKTGVAIHHGVLVVNHEHLTVTPSSNDLPAFTQRVHRDTSCALNTLLARERYDAPREIWDSREPHCMRLVDAAAQASHLVYEHVNCVAAGLVERPELMPDFAFDFGLWKTGSLEVERPPVYFDDSRPARLTLKVTPPPLLYRAFGGDVEKLVYHMERLTTRALEALREKRARPAVGAKRLVRLHPWSEPRTLRERGGERVPSFRVGARGIVGVEAEVHCAEETRWFRKRHHAVRLARRDGDASAAYPFGTYEKLVVYRAPVESEPLPDAILCRPGPLHDDIVAELEREHVAHEEIGARFQALCDEVESAFADEADDIVEHTELGLFDEPSARGAAHADDDAPSAEPAASKPPAVVRRSSPPVDKDDAPRVVTHRDRRRGRPRRSGRTSSEPPA
jgi:hypothetical protein